MVSVAWLSVNSTVSFLKLFERFDGMPSLLQLAFKEIPPYTPKQANKPKSLNTFCSHSAKIGLNFAEKRAGGYLGDSDIWPENEYIYISREVTVV